MANKRISELSPLGGSVASDDIVPMTRGAASYKLSLGQIRTYVETTGQGEHETLASLRSATPVNGAKYFTRCHTTLGDGGGGEWRGVTGSPGTYTHNGITTVLPTGGNGSAAYLRENVTVLRPEYAGTKGDNSSDDRALLETICALAANLKVPLEISRPHVVSGGINLSNLSNLRIRGTPNGSIRSTGTNKTIFYGANCKAVRIRRLNLIGNNTGLGAGGHAQEEGGGAIHFSSGFDLEVSGCPIDGFGLPGGDPVSFVSIVFFFACQGVLSEKNSFGENNEGHSSAEIGYTASRDTRTLGNFSVGRADGTGGANIPISISGNGFMPDVGVRHVVSGNNLWRAPGSISRHGILGVYDGFAVHATITGNTIEGFGWTGIYCNNGPADLGEEESGGFVVSSNIIRYCGGASYGLSGGIHLGSMAGATIGPNHIYYAGLQANGEPRVDEVAPTEGCPGIYVSGRSQDIVILGNVVIGATDEGILLGGSASELKRIRISTNTLRACGDHHIAVWAVGVLSAFDIDIDHNTIFTADGDFNAISVRTSGDGSSYDRVNLRGNTLISECDQVTDTHAVGIYLSQAEHDGLFSANIIRGFSVGVSLPGTQRSIRPWIDDSNIITDCRTSIGHRTNTAIVPYGAVPRGTIASPGASGVRMGGRILAYYSATEIPAEWSSDLQVAGAYVNGDRAMLGRNQHLGLAGRLYIETANPAKSVPIHWDVPVSEWVGSDTVANAGTMVATIAAVTLGTPGAYQVVWRYRVGIESSPNWAMGEYHAYYLRGASTTPGLVGSGFVGPALPTGWIFTPSLASGQFRLTLSNETGASHAAWVEPSLRQMPQGNTP